MKSSRRTLAVRIAAGLGLGIVLLGLGAGARGMIVEEAAQARLLVEDGQRALLASDRPKAILAFERARLFAPRAELVRSSLVAAGVHDPEPLPSQMLRIVTPPEWAAIATVFGWLGGLGLAGVVARRRFGLLGGAALVSGGVFGLAMAALAVSSRSSLSVITAGDAVALVAPYAAAQAQGPLPPGAVVTLGSSHGSFVYVQRADGLEGWVRASTLESVASQAGGHG
jgi:hypothetical protein